MIGVLDLMKGRAVHARGGRRDHYAPLREMAGMEIAGDPAVLADAYVHAFGFTELYAADLDAIGGGIPQRAAAQSIGAKAPLWLDAGVSSVDDAWRAAADAAYVIVGLETLPSFSTLHAMCEAIGGGRIAFSLDLRDGVVVARDDSSAGLPAHELARRAVDAGAGTVIVIDVARVGGAAGLDVAVVRRLRDALPDTPLLAGGGIRDLDDLQSLAACGCDGALVASAVHDGRLGRADIARARQLQRSVSR